MRSRRASRPDGERPPARTASGPARRTANVAATETRKAAAATGNTIHDTPVAQSDRARSSETACGRPHRRGNTRPPERKGTSTDRRYLLIAAILIILANLADAGGLVSGAPQAPAPPRSTDPVHYSCGCDYDRTLKVQAPFATGPDVAGAQAFLAALGFDPGPTDGAYGPMTAAAVRAFQEARGLQADGVLGARTWVAIGRTRVTAATPGNLPPPQGRVDIVIDTVDRTLTVFANAKPYREFPVAVGKPSTPTPEGQWRVASKGAWSGGFGTRWIGLDAPWGKYGIHGTNKPWYIGDAVSGGCVRMFNHDVETVFEWVAIGTQVVIIGHPFGPLRNPRRELGMGERGPDVLAVQRRLAMLGFYAGEQDGMYERSTADAVREFQRSRGLRSTGVVTPDTYDALGLHFFE